MQNLHFSIGKKMNHKKSIIQIVRSPLGGIRKHIVDIIDAAIENGYSIILVTDITESDSVFNKWSSSFSSHQKNNISIVHIPIKTLPSFSDLKNIWHIFNLAKKNHSQIIHGHGAKGGLYSRIIVSLTRLFERKNIFSCYTAHGGSLHNNFSPFVDFFYRLTETLLSPLTDLVIFESQYTKNQFTKKTRYKPKKTLLIYNGVDQQNNIEIKKLSSPVRIACFGALRHLKGHDIAIQALAKIKNFSWTLTLVGQGEEKENLIGLVNKFNLESKVQFISSTENPVSLMQEFDLILQPSRHESFGYVLIEAMSVGVPVICSNIGGMTEIVQDFSNGMLFKSENANDLAEKITLLIQDPLLQQKIIQNGFLTIKQSFSKEAMLNKILNAYVELTDQFGE
jgi:glycosyltransferase involved in cell wall biosynthesis